MGWPAVLVLDIQQIDRQTSAESTLYSVWTWLQFAMLGRANANNEQVQFGDGTGTTL